MTTKQAEWKEYTGSTEQIAEISDAPCGFVLKYSTGAQTEIFKRIGSSYIGEYIDSRRRLLSGDNLKEVLTRNKITNYLICNPHPKAEMARQQLLTGQPVWVKCHKVRYENDPDLGFLCVDYIGTYETTSPDWNIPGAEYSFTEFKEEV